MNEEHITKREIFERIRDIRVDIENGAIEPEVVREALVELETAVLQDCRQDK